MPEGKLCNRTPINTEEYLQEVLGDTSGKVYYKEIDRKSVV